jgi:TonB-dependent SusC/RagA subfamily outer membrane receptor
VVGYPKPPVPVKLPDHVKSISIKNGGKAVVVLKNGKTEEYDLKNAEERKKFDAQYPAPPPPPPPPAKGMRVEGYPVNVTTGTKIVEGKPLPDNLIYVINGKISTKFEMENIRPDQIAAVDILKGDAAVALYGENAKEGVVQIKLKSEAQPLIVIDGEISTKETMDKLKPEQIEAIDVLKGEKATAAYGEKGKNGVIMIRVKK